MVSHLPDYTVLHFPLNCCAGAAARQGGPQAPINTAIPLSLLLIIFHSPPTSLAISLVKEDRLDNLQGLSTHSLTAGLSHLCHPGSSVSWYQWSLNLDRFLPKGKISFSTNQLWHLLSAGISNSPGNTNNKSPHLNCSSASHSLVQGQVPGDGAVAGGGQCVPRGVAVWLLLPQFPCRNAGRHITLRCLDSGRGELPAGSAASLSWKSVRKSQRISVACA